MNLCFLVGPINTASRRRFVLVWVLAFLSIFVPNVASASTTTTTTTTNLYTTPAFLYLSPRCSFSSSSAGSSSSSLLQSTRMTTTTTTTTNENNNDNNNGATTITDPHQQHHHHHPFCDLPGDPSLILTTNVNLGDKKLDIMKGKYDAPRQYTPTAHHQRLYIHTRHGAWKQYRLVSSLCVSRSLWDFSVYVYACILLRLSLSRTLSLTHTHTRALLYQILLSPRFYFFFSVCLGWWCPTRANAPPPPIFCATTLSTQNLYDTDCFSYFSCMYLYSMFQGSCRAHGQTRRLCGYVLCLVYAFSVCRDESLSLCFSWWWRNEDLGGDCASGDAVSTNKMFGRYYTPRHACLVPLCPHSLACLLACLHAPSPTTTGTFVCCCCYCCPGRWFLCPLVVYFRFLTLF
jgi:hypothetical protein